MAYNPEFWQRGASSRHMIMPAFGTLLTVEYKKFVDNPEVRDGINSQSLSLSEDLESFSAADTPRGLLSALFAIEDVADKAHAMAEDYLDSNNVVDGFHNSLTKEQEAWMVDDNFYWLDKKAKRKRDFYLQTLMGGVNGVLYFAVAHAADEQLGTNEDANGFLEYLESENFMKTLREAGSAAQLFWQIPDAPISIESAGRGMESLEDIKLDSDGKFKFTSDKGISANVMAALKKHKQTKNRLARNRKLRDWDGRPSSGCPVNHTKLGPVITEQAFTEEQLESIKSVADIDENGVLTYAWDPFAASRDLVLEGTKLVLERASSELTSEAYKLASFQIFCSRD